GVIVVASTLNPANQSTSNSLRIVNLAPPTTAPKVNNGAGNNTLSVPNGLPPINLGDVPQLSPLPDISQLNLPPSQSFYVGSGTPSLSVGKLPIANIPQQSMPVSRLPIYGIPTGGSGSVPLQLPTNQTFASGGTSGAANDPNQLRYPEYSAPQSSTLPSLTAGDFHNSDLVNLYTRPPSNTTEPNNQTAMTPGGLTSPLPQGSGIPTSDVSPETRGGFKTWLQAQSEAYGQPLSAQSGPALVAVYPEADCGLKQSSSAIISAIYGPDGGIAPNANSIQVLESASTVSMNNAAITAVRAYRPPAAGIYQAFNFKVDIPYIAAVCEAANPGPSATPTSSPSPTDSPKQKRPKPSQTASPTPSSTDKPKGSSDNSTKTPTSPAASPSPEPRSGPSNAASPSVSPQTSASPSPKVSAPSNGPEAATSPEPTPVGGGDSPLGPLPSPSIVPEPTPSP
ncbi:MAG TPA: hypothetical protein V6D19_02845, partial [Stenomitos sp.]